MKLRAICPGFEQNNNSDTTLADRGTLQHKAAETHDLSILPDEEMKQAVSKCLTVTTRLEEGADLILREEILEICGGRTFGSADEIIVKGRHAQLVDLKFGRLPVDPAKDNPQIQSYVLGVFDRFPKVKTVTAWILAPYQDTVDKHTFDRSDRPAMKERILGILVRAEQYEKTRDPKMLRKSIDACQYCAHVGLCAATAPLAVAVATKYEPLEVMGEVHSSEISDPSRMVSLKNYSPILRKMADSIDHHALELAKQHGGLVGPDGDLAYELSSRAGARKLAKPKLADAVDVLREFGLSDTDLLMCSDLSVAQAVDMVADRAERGKKTKKRGEVEAALYEKDVFTEAEPTVTLKKVRKKV